MGSGSCAVTLKVKGLNWLAVGSNSAGVNESMIGGSFTLDTVTDVYALSDNPVVSLTFKPIIPENSLFHVHVTIAPEASSKLLSRSKSHS